MTWQDNLVRLSACNEAVEWAQNYETFPAAWKACKRGDWMLWLAARSGVDRKVLVLAACACARTALKYVAKGEERPRVAIETAERWARGEVTIAEVIAAAYAAYSAYTTYAVYAAYAADAVYAAAYAAYAADADAAYAAAYATYAAAYAGEATYAAAYAADAADATYAAADARIKSFARSATLVRKHITAAMIEEGWAKP